MANLNSAQLAYQHMANHPGKWFAYGDLLREIRTEDNRPLPAGIALEQRITERMRADERKGETFVQKMYVDNGKRGCIRLALIRMTRESAKAWRDSQRTKKGEELRKAS